MEVKPRVLLERPFTKYIQKGHDGKKNPKKNTGKNTDLI